MIKNGYQSIHITNNVNNLVDKIITKTQSKQQRKHKQVKKRDSALFTVAFEHTFTNYHP